MNRPPILFVALLAAALACAEDRVFAQSSGPFDAWSQAPTGGSAFSLGKAEEQTFEVETTLVAPSSEPGTRAVLAVTVRLPADSYIYAITSGGALPTSITVTESSGLEPLADTFQPDRAPVSEYEAVLKTRIEKFYREVTWTRPYRVTGDVAADRIGIRGELTGAYCSTGDQGFCVPIRPPEVLTAGLEITDAAVPTRAVSDRSASREPVRLAADGSRPGVPDLPPLGGFPSDAAGVVIEPAEEPGGPLDEDAFSFDDSAFGFEESFGELEVVTDDATSTSALDADAPFSGLGPVSDADDEADATDEGSLAGYLVFAFLGGLILNVMPCVLPVVAIKAMSFVKQAGESRARLLTLNLVYTLGVVSVFLLLASLAALPALTGPLLKLLGLSGDGIGWGGLFQSLAFNVGMATLVFAMGLSLLGVFEIPLPGFVGSAAGSATTDGLAGAFLTGVFATLLGTPCSGPLMGPVLGWSVAQPAATTFLVWGVMGLGMASPYLVFGLFPGAVKLLPKPGDWMITFKKVAGFLLVGTTVFLLNSVEGELLVPVLTGLTGLAFGLWVFGQTQMSFESSRRRLGFAGGFVAAGLGAYLGYAQTVEPEVEWRPFDGRTVESLVEGGTTVLIDFTADWCANCKTNEAVALETRKTAAFLDEYEVVPFQADYTRESPEIRDWLDRYDSISVPLTVILPGGRPADAIVLDGLFTQDKLLESLERAVSNRGPAVASLPE